jgi:hypothetical protein
MNGETANESPAFTTTHWSLVAAAGTNDVTHTRAHKALELLCQAYWYPLYSFVRRRGYSAVDAQDLTPAFLAKFLAMDGFGTADRSRGRFRFAKTDLPRSGIWPPEQGSGNDRRRRTVLDRSARSRSRKHRRKPPSGDPLQFGRETNVLKNNHEPERKTEAR